LNIIIYKNKNKKIKDDEKYCPKCDTIKKKTEYNTNIGRKDDLAGICRECFIEYKKDKRDNDPKYRQKDIEHNEMYKKSGRRAEVNKIWYKNNRTRIIKRMVEYNKKRYHSDPTYRLLTTYRRRFNKVLSNQNVKKNKSFTDLVGLEPDELRKYIEKKFRNGMNWKNIHIDHIIPCVSFDMNDEEQQRKCFNYKNLQPLLAKDNLKKGAKLDYIVLYEDEVPEVIEEMMNEDLNRLIPKKKKKVIEEEKRRKVYENKEKEIGEKIMDCIDINRIKKYKISLAILEFNNITNDYLAKIDEININ